MTRQTNQPTENKGKNNRGVDHVTIVTDPQGFRR